MYVAHADFRLCTLVEGNFPTERYCITVRLHGDTCLTYGVHHYDEGGIIHPCLYP